MSTSRVVASFIAFCFCALPSSAAPADGPEKAPDPGKAADALVITEADAGKTIRLELGRSIEVRLEGTEPATGWEAAAVEGKVVVRDGARPGELNVSQSPKFTPARDAADKAIGTYAFRYRTVDPGTSKLRFVYVSPGGPEPVKRSATRLVRQMRVTIEVTEPPAGKK